MSSPFYQVSYSRAQDSRIRVLLNEVPITWGKARTYRNTQEVMNELICPGENRFVIEMMHAKWLKGAFKLAVWRDPDVDERIVDFSWGDDQPPDIELGKVPQVFERTFVVDDITHVPCFRRADKVDFGCDGLPEQIDVIMQLQRALEMRNTTGWLDLMGLCHRELFEANHGNPGDDPATQREPIEEMFSIPHQVRPLDPKELHFERRDQGRIAIVTRLDGEPPIDAVSDGPDAYGFTTRLAPDIRLTRLDGRWQLF
jgi:hypothetical protein